MKNQKGFVPVIIILIVLIGFVGVYYLGTLKPKNVVVNPTSTPTVSNSPSSVATFKSATSDPITEWKTYQDNNMGFEIKYPIEFNVTKELIPNDGIQITLSSKNRNILIIKRTNVNPITNKEFGSLEEFDSRIKDFNKILIDQNEAWDSRQYTTQNNLIQRDIILKNSDSIWIMQDVQKIDYTSTNFDQILSTFKFTN